MLTHLTLSRLLRETAFLLEHDLQDVSLRQVERNVRTYQSNELPEFKRDLLEAGHPSRLIYMEHHVDQSLWPQFIEAQETPCVVFRTKGADLEAIIIHENRHFVLAENEMHSFDGHPSTAELVSNSQGILCLTSLAYSSPLSQPTEGEESMTPVKRLMQLLATEKKEILYVFFYASISGLVSLILPLGIQTTVELVTGGVIFSSVYLMIGLVIAGTVLSGILQMIQISMVEFLQRRVFAKAAFEFAFRIPRLRLEALSGKYAPELINRFFDVVTIQKGLPKLLIDLSSAILQILFGLLLISLYHPFFVFFGLILIGLLILIFYITGPRGLRSSIQESKYKYRVVQWLEELARAIQSFKLGGSSDLPLRQADLYVNNYLKYRKKHFNTLLTQFSFILFFKAAIIGSLLIVGTLLVVNREITVGQLVASELVIILILNAVEKIIMYIDVVYDMLTAIDKVAHVTDLPIERMGGLDLPRNQTAGFHVELKNLTYRFAPEASPALGPLSLRVQSGERIGLCGPGDAGKTVLSNIMAGIFTSYQGIMTLDGYSMNDLDLTHLREHIGKNISQDDLFEGTLLENLTVGNPHIPTERVLHAIRQVGLSDFLNSLPNGLETLIVSSGKGLSNTTIQKLILSRCIAKQPRMMVLTDLFSELPRKEKMELIRFLTDRSHTWTLIIASNDPMVLAAMDRTVFLQNGRIQAQGPFEQLLRERALDTIIDQHA